MHNALINVLSVWSVVHNVFIRAFVLFDIFLNKNIDFNNIKHITIQQLNF